VSTRSPTVLERILQSTRREVAHRKLELPAPALESRARAAAAEKNSERGFRSALTRSGIGVIAEFKRRSPSAGMLGEGADVGQIVSSYERGGACALSVLTEAPNFGGSLEDLVAARDRSVLPILRKDFIVDPYQLHEAVAANADAVLLIVAALAQQELASLHACALGLGLDVLVEVHDQPELQIALDLEPNLVGINNRDLRDFSVDVERTSQLMRELPRGVTVVSESGIATAEQLRRLQSEGVDAVLVGESLMRSADPERALRALTAGL
jgi:indole-3-glycerol phosphate synthase